MRRGRPDPGARRQHPSPAAVRARRRLVFASILLLGGLGALSYSLWSGRAAALARVGFVGAVVGTAVRLVQESIDLAVGEVAEDWDGATIGVLLWRRVTPDDR